MKHGFEVGSNPGRGRGLRATRRICAGEAIFRESPVALVLYADTPDDNKTIHRMIAGIIIASRKPDLAECMSQLVTHHEEMQKRDPLVLNEVAANAVPAVQKLVEQHAGSAAASMVDAVAVVDAFCKHVLNSMTITEAQSLAPAGMGLYPRLGALINHSNHPNCWTFFEEDSNALVLRSLTPIAQGSELTIAYVDTACPREELRKKLQARYFFDSELDEGNASLGTARPSLMPSGFEVLREVERIGRENGYSLLHAHSWCDAELASVDVAITQAVQRAQRKDGDDPRGTGGTATIGPDEFGVVLRSGAPGGSREEPCMLIAPLTRALEESARLSEWRNRLGITRQLLYVYPFYYTISHPLLGIRHLDGALAALKIATSGGDISGGAEAMLKLVSENHAALAAVLELGRKAVRILTITHGVAHNLTLGAAENVQLVESLTKVHAAMSASRDASLRPTNRQPVLSAAAAEAAEIAAPTSRKPAVVAAAADTAALDAAATDVAADEEAVAASEEAAAANAPAAATAAATTRKARKKQRAKKASAAARAVEAADASEVAEASSPGRDEGDARVALVLPSSSCASCTRAVAESELAECDERERQLDARRAALLSELACVDAMQAEVARCREILQRLKDVMKDVQY